MDKLDYDTMGKINLNGIYNQSEPTEYYSTLSRLDYQIPQNAKPQFQRLIQARRRAAGAEPIKVIDLGCSYGVNAALLKHGLSMNELYRQHGATEPPGHVVQRDDDRNAEQADAALEMIGVDRADRAISYAVDAGMLDGGVITDLEIRDPTLQDVATLENADLIISTGCVGYVGEATLERLLNASSDSRPWMAHFVLRMFDFRPSQEMLEQYGYVTEKFERLFRQRRFASLEERQHVLDNLVRLGIDPTDAEETGWYLAELHVARPEAIAMAMPLHEILDRDTGSF